MILIKEEYKIAAIISRVIKNVRIVRPEGFEPDLPPLFCLWIGVFIFRCFHWDQRHEGKQAEDCREFMALVCLRVYPWYP